MVLSTYYAQAGFVSLRNDDINERLLAIFERLSNQDLRALEPLYDLCAGLIYGLALWRTGSSADAADVVHSVFIRLAKNSRKLAGVKKPRAYLLQAASHAAIDIVRKRRTSDISIQSPEFVEPHTTDERLILRTTELESALLRLSNRQREAIYLRYFCDLSFAEISDITGVSLFTAAARCRLGLARLRKIMGVKR